MDGTRGHADRRQELFQIVVLNAQTHDLEAQSNRLFQGMPGGGHRGRRTVREDEDDFPFLLQRAHPLHDPPQSLGQRRVPRAGHAEFMMYPLTVPQNGGHGDTRPCVVARKGRHAHVDATA